MNNFVSRIFQRVLEKKKLKCQTKTWKHENWPVSKLSWLDIVDLSHFGYGRLREDVTMEPSLSSNEQQRWKGGEDQPLIGLLLHFV